MRYSLGIDFSTFSIIGRCARTGMLGVAITTSDLCVGSRCPYVAPGIGAVSTQAATDPRIGPRLLALMAEGRTPGEAVAAVESEDAHIERRQIGAVSIDGQSFARTGARNGPWAGHVALPDHVAMGNGLAGERVVEAMSRTFVEREADNLEERLLASLEAGQEVGGERRDMTPYHSAGLLVYGSASFSRVDLRVDEHPTPIVELRRVLDLFKPKIDYFALRADDPETALAQGPPQPSYRSQ